MTTIDLFLQELKSHYTQEYELKSTLENKANYLLVAAGITITLLFSFGSTMIDSLTREYEFLTDVVVSLMIGIILNATSILFSVLAFFLRRYKFAVPYYLFYNKDGTPNKAIIKQYRDGMGNDENESEKIFKNSMVYTYLRCNKANDEQNNFKANMIKISQWLFFAGSLSIIFIIAFALPYLWSKPTIS